MKKLCNIILTLVLSFTLLGCSTFEPIQDNALDTLETTIQNLSNIKASHYGASLHATAGEDYTTLSITGAFKNNPTNYSMNVGMKAAASGEEFNYDDFMVIAMDDQYAYTNFMGMMKYKTPVSKEDTSQPISLNESIDFDKEGFKQFLTKASYQDNTIHLEFNTDKFSKELQKVLQNESITASDPTGVVTGLMETYANLKMNEITANIIVKDNMLADLELSVKASDTSQEVAVDNNVILKLSFSEINGDVKVEMPSDADTYELMDDASMLLP